MSDFFGIGTAIGSIGSSLLGNAATKKVNKDNRIWQKHMWDLNNEYNTPANQRARLKAANMSPALAYGNGSVANTSQNQNMPDAQVPEQPNFGAAIAAYQNARQVDASIKNTEIATDSLQRQTDADMALKAANTVESLTRSDTGKWDLQFKRDMVQTSKDALTESLRQLRLGNESSTINNRTLDARNQATLNQSFATIRSLSAQTDKTRVEKGIQEELLKMWKKGINPNDSAIIRQISGMIPQSLVDNIRNYIQELTKMSPSSIIKKTKPRRGWH